MSIVTRVRALCAEHAWNDLGHAYGYATDVPSLLEDLATGSAAVRANVVGQLWGNVYHQGSRYEASPAALSVIVQLARESQILARVELLDLAVGLRLGFEGSFVARGYDPSHDVVPPELAEHLRLAYDARVHDLGALLADDDAAVRARAARALGWIEGPREVAAASLRARFEVETDAIARGTIVVALSFLGAGDAEAERALADDEGVVRSCGAIALVRAHGASASPRAKATLLAASQEGEIGGPPYLGGDLGQLAASVASAIKTREGDPDVVRALCAALQECAPARGLSLTTTLLDAAGLGAASARSKSELGELQLEALRAIASTDASWLVLNVHADLRARGLPSERAELAALAGVEVSIDEARVARLGASLLAGAMPDKALERYESLARTSHVGDAALWRELAELRALGGGDVLAAWRRAAELDPDDERARWRLADLDALDEALEVLDGLAERDPRRAALVRSSRLREAGRLDDAYAALDALPGDAVDVVLARGVLADLRGRSDEALALYREATRIEPAEPLGWANLGGLSLRRGELELACEATERALELDPDFVAGYGDLALARIRLEHWDDALRALDRGLAKSPDDGALRYNRACVLSRTGDVRGALVELARVVTLDLELARGALDDPDLAPLRSMGLESLLEGGAPPPAPSAEIVQSRLASAPRAWVSASAPVRYVEIDRGVVHISGRFDQVGTPTGSVAYFRGTPAHLERAPWPLVRATTEAVVDDGLGGFVLGGELRWGDTEGGALVRVDGEGRPHDGWVGAFGGMRCLALAHSGEMIFAIVRERGAQPALIGVDLARAKVVWRPRFDRAVTAIVVSGDRLFVGGDFTRVDDHERPTLCAFDLRTLALEPLQIDPTVRQIRAIATHGDTVYVGGRGESDVLVGFDGQGAIVFRPQLGPSFAEALALLVDGDCLRVGGSFASIDGARRTALAAFSLPDHRLLDWAPAPEFDPAIRRVFFGYGDSVERLTRWGEHLVVAGRFNEMGGRPARGLALLEPGGSGVDLAIRPNEAVRSIATNDGGIALVGWFSMIDQPAFPGAASIAGQDVTPWEPVVADPDVGARDARGRCHASWRRAFPQHVGRAGYRGDDGAWELPVNGAVRSIALDAERVWIAGEFTRVGDQARTYAACIARASGEVLPWSVALDRPALGIVRAADCVLVGGRFRRVGHLHASNLVALGVDDASVHELPFAIEGVVRLMASSASFVFVSGAFSTTRGPLRSKALLLDRETLEVLELRLDLQKDKKPAYPSAACFCGDRLVLAGAFDEVNGHARDGLAELDLHGSVSAWQPAIKWGSTAPIALAASEDGLVLGSGFTVPRASPPIVNLAAYAYLR